MEKIQNSLRKFSSVIFVFAKIGYIASIVGVCLSACAMICLAATGRMSLEFALDNGATLRALFAEVEGNAATVWGSLAYALTYCIFLIVVMRLIMRLFANMRDNYTPFTMENAELFKKMAIWMIVASIVPATVGQTVGMACAKMMQLSFAGEYSDGFSILSVLVLFAMSTVFKYGCALQEQADTTL